MKVNKRISTSLLILFAACALLHPSPTSWETRLTQLLTGEQNYRAAFDYLETRLDTIEKVNKPFGYLTLAFCAHNLKEKNLETKSITAFFEKYKGQTDVFPLTDNALNRKIGDYLRSWRAKYPLVSRLGLVRDSAFRRSVLPRELTVGVEMDKETHYRLLYRGEVLAGGLLQKGFNFIQLPTAGLFRQSGTHAYVLDLKAGELTVQKSFQLDVKCYSPGNSGQVKDYIRKSGYGVAMFIENRLIAYHKKSVTQHRLTVEDNHKLRRMGDRLVGRPPDPLNREEKALQRASLPVLAIPMLAYKHLIKPKLKKKPKKVILTFDNLSATFLRKDRENVERPLEVEIIFKQEL
ncbi:MAG: hypothetical protein GY950_03115 [bacterium]|nr:hypothetical protein [bacterium]